MKRKADYWHRVGDYMLKVDKDGHPLHGYKVEDPDETYLVTVRMSLDAAKMRSSRHKLENVLLRVDKEKLYNTIS